MREQRNIELGEEIKGRWLGPVPLKEFLLEFLPLPKDAPAKKEICFKYIAAAGSKAQIAARFVEAANKAALPRLSFVNTATSGKSSYDSEKLGPDVTAVSDATRIRYGGSPDEGEERKTYVDFGYSDLIVEVKGKKTDDAFNDLPATTQDAKEVDEQEEVNESEESAKEVEVEDQETVKGNRTKKALKKSEPLPFERDTNAACATRGQLATYTAAQSGAQFRTHSFSLFIFGPCARLIRWDRSCALVSERFEYGKSPNNYLADFLHRYSLLDDKGRGKDPTLSGSPSSAGSQAGGKVAPVAPGECPPGMEEELHSSNALNPKKGPRKTELRRILIPDRDNPEAVHPHIISYPLPFVARSPFGRATRPFLAYNPATDRIVFVKDYWRSTTLGISKEGDIYKKLKDNNVRHVPPFGHGNDIPGQQTIDLSKYKWVTEVPDTLQHYRMSLKVVGDSLKDFPSTKILVSAVADAMEGHDDAYFDAHILHRDVSMGNILIAKDQGQYRGEKATVDEEVDSVKKGSGLLIDWDLCVDVENSGLSRAGRTGTWPFISAALLARMVERHSIEDDRESSFYTILYPVLRFSKHSAPGDKLNDELEMFDELNSRDDGFPTGGKLKRGLILSTVSYPVKFNPPLDEIINGALNFFRPRYTPVSEEDKAAYEKAKQKGYEEEELNELTTYGKHRTGLRKIHERGNWVAFLRQNLNKPGWPESDCHKHPIIGTRPAQKRKRWYSETELPILEGVGALANKRSNLGLAAPFPTRADQAALEARI